jgi:opacity protein-like surface antigen
MSAMTKAIYRTLAVAALASVASTSVFAADMDGGTVDGIRGYHHGGVVAVPAPIPYTETYKWYLRGDVGGTLARSGDVSATGLALSLNQPTDWAASSMMSLGFGRYLTPSIRFEMALDIREKRRFQNNTQIVDHTADTTVAPNIVATNSYDVTRTEYMKQQSNTLMLNAYYDLIRGGRITPYIGGGIGIALHTINRTSSETSACIDARSYTTDSTGAPAVVTAGCNAPASFTLTGQSSNGHGIGLAAQFAAGVNVDLLPRVHWDTGYRLVWMQGKVAAFSDSLAGFSTVRFGDIINHEVRTGLRFDLY